MKLTKVPMVLKGLNFSTETVDGDERKVIVATLRIPEFGKRLATTFVPDFAASLFNGDSKPVAELLKSTLAIPAAGKEDAALVRVEIRRTEDSKRATVILSHVAIAKEVAIAHEDVGYSATFKVSFRYPDAKDLLILANAVATQFWLSLAPQQGDLLDKAKKA